MSDAGAQASGLRGYHSFTVKATLPAGSTSIPVRSTMQSVTIPPSQTEVLRTTRDPAALGLPLERGMTARALEARLGKPAKRYSFVPGQERFEFKTRAPRYRISCSVEKPGGLSYVVVTRLR